MAAVVLAGRRGEPPHGARLARQRADAETARRGRPTVEGSGRRCPRLPVGARLPVGRSGPVGRSVPDEGGYRPVRPVRHEGDDVKLRWRGRRTAPVAGQGEPDGLDDEFDDLDDLAAAESAGGARPAGGPVLLTLTTREQVEKAAAAEAEPKMIRVRPGRGAFGGTAGGGGCAHH